MLTRTILAAALLAIAPQARAQSTQPDPPLRPSGHWATYRADTFEFQVPAEWLASGPEPGAARGVFRGPDEPADGGAVPVTLEFERIDAADGTARAIAGVIERTRARTRTGGAHALTVIAVDAAAGPGARISYVRSHGKAGPARRTVVYAVPLAAGSLATFTWTYPARPLDRLPYGAIAEQTARSASPPKAVRGEPWVWRSSRLGVEITLPAGWEEGSPVPFGCGGRIDLNPDPAQRPTQIAAFRTGGGPPSPWVGVTVTAVRELTPGNDPTSHLRRAGATAQSAEFAFSSHKGEKLIDGAEPVYFVRHGPGAVWLSAAGARGRGAAAIDAVAASLRLFPPTQEPCDPGATRTFRGLGFAFDHPGDWTVSLPYEDAEAARPRAGGTLSPCDPSPRGHPESLLAVDFGPAKGRDDEPLTPDEAESLYRFTDPTHAPEYRTDHLRTRAGLPVRKVIATHTGGRTGRITRFGTYLIELPDGTAFAFTARPLPAAPAREARVDAIVTSFRPEPLPWDAPDAQPRPAFSD